MSARPLAKDIIPDKACIGVLGQSLWKTCARSRRRTKSNPLRGNMSKFLLTVCAFGLLLSPAFAEEKSPEQLREERSRIFGIEGLACISHTN
jgi:hypothetical protein